MGQVEGACIHPHTFASVINGMRLVWVPQRVSSSRLSECCLGQPSRLQQGGKGWHPERSSPVITQ